LYFEEIFMIFISVGIDRRKGFKAVQSPLVIVGMVIQNLQVIVGMAIQNLLVIEAVRKVVEDS